MITDMPIYREHKKWGPGVDLKKTIANICIEDKTLGKTLQYTVVSKDNIGFTYDFLKNAVITTVLEVPAIEKDKVAFIDRNKTLNKIPGLIYAKSKNRRHFDIVFDVNNILA